MKTLETPWDGAEFAGADYRPLVEAAGIEFPRAESRGGSRGPLSGSGS